LLRNPTSDNGSRAAAASIRGLSAELAGPLAGGAVRVAIDALVAADSPRLDGVDPAHAEALAEVDGELPPIVVHRATMRVIDGMHRLDAARIRGETMICARFFDGDEDEAFLLAVAANTKHGLPLTLTDRRAAAARIIGLRADASDRWIAEIAGLAAKTVAAVRRDARGTVPAPARRLGRDGRFRPLNIAEGRRIASEVLAANPGASLRQVARDAGISVGTARDVREKVRQGIDPVAPRQACAETRDAAGTRTRRTGSEVNFDVILNRLRQDPSIRYAQAGRAFLSWLCPPRLMSNPDWEKIIDSIPPHCTFDVIRIARSCALAWTALAEELDQRNRAHTQWPPPATRQEIE
jgi:ParB-like nuclease domain